MHPIFTRPSPERLRAIRDEFPLSVCLHEAGHAWVGRALGAPFTTLRLPDLNAPPRATEPGPADAEALDGVRVNTAGFSRSDRISALLGGYAGELCLYEHTYLARNGEFFTRLDCSIDDAAAIAKIVGRPTPTTVRAAERILVEALMAVNRKPYTLLTRDLAGFRRWVSRLHAAWEHAGFRGLDMRADLLPEPA
ncbi:hypothetical protein ACQKQD_32675 [Methylobacterium sp. NPDC080182]|uniref:hypothetical protein n=1 Tax=Methylobacterium sp. NPDC080182 TaxID=3390590 RepID=UPI003CFE7E17